LIPHQNTFRAARKDPHHAPEVSKLSTLVRCAVVRLFDRAIAVDGGRFDAPGISDNGCQFIGGRSAGSCRRNGISYSGRVAA
jgi:hypothetical protein